MALPHYYAPPYPAIEENLSRRRSHSTAKASHPSTSPPPLPMAKRNRAALAAAANESSTPPSVLNPSQSVARVVGAEGSSVYTVALPSAKTVPVELAPLFRNTIWLKRGGYVLVDLASMADRQKSGSRIVGEIVNVVRDEKAWRKMAYW